MINKKIALITGVTGQDGYFLSRLLLKKNYEVHALIRRIPENDKNIEYIDCYDKGKKYSDRQIIIHYGDMTDSSNLTRIIKKIEPDEIYNLAGISNVKISFDVPENTADSVAIGVLRILEIIKNLDLINKTKFYQASTSELFGNTLESPQDEMTRFNPKSPYAIAKLYSFYLIKYYREAYGMYAVNGILFNHESERRGREFVTRKITMGVAKISKGLQEKLFLGNLDAKRDWGYAKDYVECMWLMLQHDKPEDFVIATGEQHTVREFCEIAFKEVGIEIEWQGEGIEEKGICKKTKKILVEISKEYFRPLEVNSTVGNPQKAHKELNWNPKKTPFKELIRIMVKNDLKLLG